MNKTTLISALAVVAVIALGAIFFGMRGGEETASDVPAATQGETSGNDTATADAGDAPAIADMTLGNPDAPVKVTEYASYTCSHCGAFHNESFKAFKADYIDTGKVHFTYREVYFDRAALWASMVARCGGEERFFGISDLIYKGQRDWIGSGDPVEMADGLRKVGRVAGLDEETLDACLADDGKAQALVAWFQSNAEADGIDSTPTFLINGEKITGNNPTRLRDTVDAQLAN